MCGKCPLQALGAPLVSYMEHYDQNARVIITFSRLFNFAFFLKTRNTEHKSPRIISTVTVIENVSSMDILGVAFNNNLKHSIHVNNRIQKCYRSFYSLRNAGFSYPGVHSDVKSYICGNQCVNQSCYIWI